jgi:hypothetical protein
MKWWVGVGQKQNVKNKGASDFSPLSKYVTKSCSRTCILAVWHAWNRNPDKPAGSLSLPIAHQTLGVLSTTFMKICSEQESNLHGIAARGF